MISLKTLCTCLFIGFSYVLVECRSYNNGLIFYNLENQKTYLPPTISVSRGRGLAKFKYSSRGSIWSTFGKPCNCEGPLCGCCVGIKVKQYNFDQKMCANVTYARPKDEIQLEVFLNDTATAKYGIAARNPSPLCVPIMMGIPMSMCIQMSNIAVQGDNLNMCMDFLVRLASTEIFEMHFQCMQVGLQGASWVGADGQPVIPANEGKLKDKSTNESDEYYDESAEEEENEIISNEKEEDEEENIEMSVEEEDDLNKAEEEMDYNDITEQVMDIVKEEEHSGIKEHKNHVVSPLQDNKVEEIVTNIMESINQGNAAAEGIEGIMAAPVNMPAKKNQIQDNKESNVLSDIERNEENEFSMEAEETKAENVEQNIEINALETLKNVTNEESKENIENGNKMKEEILENSLESLANAEDDIEENNEIIESSEKSEDLSSGIVKDELHFEQLAENSQEKEIQMANNITHSQETNKESNDLSLKAAAEQDSESNKIPAIVMEEITTEHIADDQDYTAIEKLEMLINSDDAAEEISKNDNELNNSLDMLQQTMETSTEHLMAANLETTNPQDAATTSEISNISSGDSALTTAAIMTTTTTTTTKTTTTNKPTKFDENSTVAETFIITIDGVDKNNNDNDDDNDHDEGNENSDGDDDNSYENDSDYDDEESEETDDDTKEKVIKSNNATTIVKPNTTKLNNKNGIEHKISSTAQELANESLSNESTSDEDSNETTNDEFATEEEQFEENAVEKYHRESNEQNENDATEEEYDGEYEDYQTTAKTLTISDNNTCCKPAISFIFNNSHVSNTIQKLDDSNNDNDNNNNAEIPQIDTASSNNLQFVSNTKSMISNTDDVSMLNVESTTNKMSQIIAGASATKPNAIATARATTTTAATSSNVMPLPLARKLYSLHQQQQQQQHYRRSREQQYYG